MAACNSGGNDPILERARAGDADAHATLYRTHAPMIFTIAFRMLGSRATAEDVLQDSFVEVIRKAADFRGDCPIESWIKRIAVNKCLSHLRSPWSVRRSQIAEDNPGPEDNHAQAFDRARAVDRAFRLLSPVARSVVWLHDVEGYTHGEIGELMGRSTSFSKTQLARAHALLRERLRCADDDEEAPTCLGILKTV